MVEGAKIKNCAIEFAFECPKVWGALKRTSDKTVRYCEVCKLAVHFCDTQQKAQQKAGQGLCVAMGPNVEAATSATPARKRKIRVGVVRLAPEPEKDPPEEKGDWSKQRDGKRARNKSRR